VSTCAAEQATKVHWIAMAMSFGWLTNLEMIEKIMVVVVAIEKVH